MTFLYAQAIASVALLALAAAGSGRWIALLERRDACDLERAALGLAGGLGVLGTLLFVLGQMAFSRWPIAAVLIAAGLLGITPLKAFLSSGYEFSQRFRVPQLAAATIVFVLLVTAVAGLAEITGGWENDAVAYHLLGPTVWLRDGVIRPVPDNCLTAFPQTAEVLFAAVMAVGGNRAPGFSAAFTLGLLLLSVALLARRAGLGRDGAWWSMALVASMPAVYSGAHSGFIDAVYASFVLAAAAIVLEARAPADFAALGLFCGLAMGTKYTGILAIPALFIVSAFLWIKFVKGSALLFLRNWSIAGSTAALVASPFYLRNWIVLGSPIYPPPVALLRFFHPKYLPAAMLQQMQETLWLRGEGLGRGLLAYLALPYNLTYHTSRFHGAGGIGLAPLAFCPLALLLGARQKFAQAVALLAWIMLTTWFLQQESRYLIPVYAMLAVLAVLGWRGLLATTDKAASAAAVVMLVSLAYGCLMIASASAEDLHSAVSPAYAQKLRTERITFLTSFDYLNSTSTAHKVLILDRSVQPYYLERSYLKPIGQWGEQVLPGVTRAVEVLPRAKELGITHVLDVSTAIAPFQVPRNFPGLMLVLDLPDQRVYQVL
jgi:hypothetical protein